jgi:hypothetical protein
MELVVSRFMAWTWHFFSTATLMKEVTLIGIIGLLILVQKLVVVNLEENGDSQPNPTGVSEMLWLLLMVLGAVVILFFYPMMDPSDEIHAYTWRDMNGQLMMLFFCLSITKNRVVQLTNMMLPGVVIAYLVMANQTPVQFFQLVCWVVIALSVAYTQKVTIGLRRGGWRRWAAEITFASGWWAMLVISNGLTLEHFLVLIGEFSLSMFIVYRGCRVLRYLWVTTHQPVATVNEVE